MSQPPLPPYPTGRRKVRSDILFTFAVAILLYLAWLLRDVLVLLYVSVLFSVVLMPVVRRVQQMHVRQWHPNRGIAILIIMVLLIAAIVAFLIFTLPPIIHEVTAFVKTLPERSSQLVDKLRRFPILRNLNFSAIEARLNQETTQNAVTFFSSIGNGAAKFFEIVTGVILTVYFLAEGEHAYRWFLSLIPIDRRGRLDETLQRAAARMGQWLLGQLALMLLLGITSAIVFGAMHLRYAFALALLMGCFNIVPVVGALISTSFAMIVAATDSWGKVLGVLIFELIYAQIENAFLTPRIMKTRVDLAGTAVLIALLLGGALAGIAGILVAVPSAVLVTVLVEEYIIRPARVSHQPETAPETSR